MPLDLLFSRDELPRIRTTLARPEFAPFWSAARGADLADDERFLHDEIRLNEPVRDLARAASILQRSAFVHVVAPDARHRAVARLALSRVLAYRRWDWILEAGHDTVGVMRNGTTAVAAVLAADWLADDLPDDEHEALCRHLAQEAGPAAARAIFGMTHHDRVVGWSMDPDATGFARLDVSRWPAILDVNNLRVIATAGLAATAACLRGRHGCADEWAARAADSLRLFASRQPADASFPEGPSYWHFTYTYFVLSLELLHRRCGLDLRDLLDFPAMARYVQLVTTPTRALATDCINVGDANTSASAEALAWIGRHHRDTTANHLVTRPGCVRPTATSAWAAIWFDPTVPARPAADLASDRVIVPGVVISRAGWEVDDAFLAFRSGEPENHEHADRNSLIFGAHGERLLHDPLHASYARADPKWLLRLTAAHTAVLIDGRGHVYHEGEEGTNASTARARLLDHRLGPAWMAATSDATDAYQRAALPVTRVVRTVVFFKPDILIVFDDVRLAESLPVQTRWQIYNEDGRGHAMTNGERFTISRPHATLAARVVAEGPFTVATAHLPVPGDPGVYPLVEVTSHAGTRHRLLTIATAAPAGEAHGALAVVAREGVWRVTGTHRGRPVQMTCRPTADGPPELGL